MLTTGTRAATWLGRRIPTPPLGVGLCFLTLAIALLGSFPAAAHAQSGVATYESPINGFRFQYPADWELGALPVAVSSGNVVERVGLSAPDGMFGLVTVIQLNVSLTDADIPAVKPELDRAYEAGAAQLGGEVIRGEIFDASDYGIRYAFSYQINFPKDGQVIESRQYAFILVDRQYSITIEADAAGHDRHPGVLDGILYSFGVDER